MATYTALVDVQVNTRRVNKAFKNIEGSLLSINKRTARTNQFFQRLEASFGRVEKQLSALNRQTTNSIRAMRSMKQVGADSSKEIEKLKKQVADLNKQLKQSKSGFTLFGDLFKSLNKVYRENAYLIQTITAGLFAFVQYNLIGGIKRLSDQFILMQSRLRVVNDSQDVFNKNLLQSFEIAQKTRQPLFQVANTLARIGRNSSVLQKDFTKLGRITETIGKSFQVAGATIEEANNAMIQLSQAFASGRLQGDELRSVLELAPRLAQGIAKQIGISVGSLRAFAKEGRLTTEVLRLAIQGASEAVDRDFKKVQQTIGQAVTNVNSTLLMLVGTTNMVTGTNQKFVNAIERINKALQGLAGDEMMIFIADALGLIADNMELVIKVAASFIATGVAAAFLMALKAVVGSLGLFLIPLAAVSAGMYYFMDSMIDTKREAGQSFKKILEEAEGPLTSTEKEIRKVENRIIELKRILKEGNQQEGDWKWMYDLLEVFQKIDDSAKSFFERLMKDGKGLRVTAKHIGAEPDPTTEAGRAKLTKEQIKLEKDLTVLEQNRIADRKLIAIAKKAEAQAQADAEREAELKFLETYEVQLQAAKKLNEERLKGVDAELAFVTKYDNFTDIFGAQKYQKELSVATAARKEFAKILQGFNEAPGTFGEIIKNGRVSEDALLNALETKKLEERFQKEPALREALKKDALRITDNLNTELIEAERRRLAEQAQIYNGHLHAMAEQRRSVDLGIAFAAYGDPNQLGGQELASYERMRDLEAGAEQIKQLKAKGIFDEKALQHAKEQGEELNQQLRTLREIVNLNQIRAQTEDANVSYIKKQADLDLDRSIITGKLTKEGQKQKNINDSVLAIQDELNIKSEHMKVLKDGAIDIDLKAAKLSKKEIDKLGELIKREEKRREVKELGIATGEMDDAASQKAVQSSAVKGIMGAGGESAQRAQQTMVAYQAAGGGMMGMINAITSLVLSNKKVMEAITTIFDAIMEPIDAILDPIGELISSFMMMLKPFQVFNKLIGKMLGGMIKSLTQIIHPLSSFLEAAQPILVMVGVFVQMAVQFISALVGGIAEVVEFLVNQIIGPQDDEYKPETLLAEEASILDQIQTSLEGAADALEKINDVVFEITNSALNLLAPSIKLEDAKDKYDELFALAKNIGDDESIDEFTSYARDYLQQSQDVLKSSAAYQGIYDSVISDLGTLQKNIKETVSDDLTKELKGAVFNLDLVGSDLGDSIRDIVDYFREGSLDYVDIMTYVAYKSSQVATDLELKQMAEFGQIDSSEYARIRKARGAASSSSGLAEDLNKLNIDLVVTNPEHIAVGLSRSSGGLSVSAVGEDDSALAMTATAHASGIPVIQDPPTARFLAGGGSPTSLSSISSGSSVSFSDYSTPTIGNLGESQSFKLRDPFEMFGGAGFDLVEMFAQIGQLIIDGLIAALEAIGATAEAILKAIFGFIQTALDQASDLVGQILSFIMGPIKDALDSAANVAMTVLGSILTPISEALFAFPDIATGVLNAVLVPIRDALYGISNLGPQVLSAIFGGISNLQVSAAQFLTGIFMPILNLIGKVDINQFFSALIFPIMKALSGSFSGVGDLFQKMVIDPIMNAIGMNNLPDLMNIAQEAVNAVKKVIGVDVTGIFGWDINDFFDDVQDKISKTFTADFSKIFGGWDLGKFIEDTMDELNDLFSIDVPSGHIKLLPNPFKGNFGGPSHFIDFKFAEGGEVNMPGGLAKGPSHDRGGIKAVVAPRTANAGLIEFEGGEYIIKKSTVDFLGEGILDAINSKPELFMGGQHFFSGTLPMAYPYGASIPPEPGARTSAREYPITGGFKYEEGGLSPNGFPSKDYGDLGVIGGKEAPQLLSGFFNGIGPGFPLKIIDFAMRTGGDVQRLFNAAGLGGPYGAEGHWTAKSIGEHSAGFKIGHLKNGGRVDKFQAGGITHAQTGILGGDRGAGVLSNALGFMQGSLPLVNHKGKHRLARGYMPPPFWGCEIRRGGTFGYEIVCHGANAEANLDYNLMAPFIKPDFRYTKAKNGGLVEPGMGLFPRFKSGGLVAGGGFKSRCNACGSSGSSASYGAAIGYADGGIVSFQNGGNSFGYNPLTYDNMSSRGIQYTSSEITNETISLFDPLLFEGFQGLESYETGFQDVGNQLIDQFKLAYNQGVETNRLLGLLIEALYSEIGRLERTIIEYLETLPEVVETMDRNITAAINQMNTELKEEIYLMGQGIEEEIRKIAPSFGLLIIEIQAAFVQAILDAGLDKLFEESLKNMEISIPKAVVEGVEGSFDKLITGSDSVEEQTRRALESVFDNSGGGIKVITESMGDPWYDDMEEIFDEFLGKLVKRAAIGGLVGAVAAYIGGTAGIAVAAAGALLAFSDEIATAYSGSDLEAAVNKYIDVNKEGAAKLEKEIANLGVIFSDKNISEFIRDAAFTITLTFQHYIKELEKFVSANFGALFQDVLKYADILKNVIIRFLQAPGKFFEGFAEIFDEILEGSGIAQGIRNVARFISDVINFFKPVIAAIATFTIPPLKIDEKGIENIVNLIGIFSGIYLGLYTLGRIFGAETPEQLVQRMGEEAQQFFDNIGDAITFIANYDIDLNLPTADKIISELENLGKILRGIEFPKISQADIDNVVGFFEDVGEFFDDLELPKMPEIDIDIDFEEIAKGVGENFRKFFAFGENLFGEGVDMDNFFKMDSIGEFNPFEGVEIDPGRYIENLMSPVTDLILDAGTFLFGNSPTGLLAPVQDLVGKLDPTEFVQGLMEKFGNADLNVGTFFELFIDTFFGAMSVADDFFEKILTEAFKGLSEVGIPVEDFLNMIFVPLHKIQMNFFEYIRPVLEPINDIQANALEYLRFIFDPISKILTDGDDFLAELLKPVHKLTLDAMTFLFGNSPTGLLAPVQDLVGKLDPSEFIKGMLEGFGEMDVNVGSLFELIITKFFEGYSVANDIASQIINLALDGLGQAGLPIKEFMHYIMEPFTNVMLKADDVLRPIMEPISKIQMSVFDFVSGIFEPIYDVALEADQWLAGIMKPIQNLIIDVGTFLFGNSPTGLLAPVEALVGMIDPSVFLNTILDAIMGTDGAAQGASAAIDGIIETITGFILGFFEQFASVLHSFIPTQVAEVFGNVSEEIMNTFFFLGNSFLGLLDDIIGYLGDALDPSAFANAFTMTVAFNILGATGRAGPANAPNAVEFNFLPDLLKGNIFGSVSKTGIGVRAFGSQIGMTTDYEAGGLLKGPSHANGGIPGMVGGKQPIEMEGGEYIIKKDTVAALGVPFFEFLNSQDKSTVSGSPTEKTVKNYFEGGLMDPLRDATKTIYDWGVGTSGDIAKILGEHGIESFLKFKTGIPAASMRVYDDGGPVEGALAAGANMLGQVRNAIIDISGSNFFGSAGIEAGIEGGKSLFVDPYLDSYLRLKPPTKWKFFDQGGPVSQDYTDPELRTLMQELILTIKDKEMGVNIYNETGQNMSVADGEGAGFDESSYRESSNLA